MHSPPTLTAKTWFSACLDCSQVLGLGVDETTVGNGVATAVVAAPGPTRVTDSAGEAATITWIIAATFEAMPVIPDMIVHLSLFFRRQKNVTAKIAPMRAVMARSPARDPAGYRSPGWSASSPDTAAG